MAKQKNKKSGNGTNGNGSANRQPSAGVSVEDILRDTSHALTIFKPKTIAGLSIFLKRGKPYLTCYATGKDRPAKPEGIVRQLYVKMLMDNYGYPAERIAIEKPVQFGSAVHDKAADIVIWDKDDPNTAFITNHGYLDNPTFRGMRWALMQAFDEIYVLDLHGNTKKKEVCPGGSPDQNVFDIQQGVAICLMVKLPKGKT